MISVHVCMRIRAYFNHSPAQVAPMVQQKTDSTDGNEDQEYLLLRHRSQFHWDCGRRERKKSEREHKQR